MALASEILARAYESNHGPFPELSDVDVVNRFRRLDAELHLLMTLRALQTVHLRFGEQHNAILSFASSGVLEIKSFRDAEEALRTLFELEKQEPDSDPVLVRADTGRAVMLAFKNYFYNASDFVEMAERGARRLLNPSRRKQGLKAPRTRI